MTLSRSARDLEEVVDVECPDAHLARRPRRELRPVGTDVNEIRKEVVLAKNKHLLIDCEEDRTLRALLVSMLREKGGQVAEQSQGWRHMNRLMRATLLAFVVSLVVWGLIAVWTQIRVYELLRTWQIIAVDVAIVSGLVMLALLVYAAWERLIR